MRRPALRELRNPLIGMAMFLAFAVRGYLRNDSIAFWGHAAGLLWFLADAITRTIDRDNLRKTIRIVAFVVCFVMIEGYVLWQLFLLPRP